MKSSTIIAFSVVLFLAFLAISEGMGDLGVQLHCRCIKTESRPIGRHIEKVELIPANSHCDELEIIATLKKTAEEVCLNPQAPWVKKVIEKIISSKRHWTETNKKSEDDKKYFDIDPMKKD